MAVNDKQQTKTSFLFSAVHEGNLEKVKKYFGDNAEVDVHDAEKTLFST